MIVKDTTKHISVLGKGETKCLLRLHSSAYDSVPNRGSCCHPYVHLAWGFPRTAACSTNKRIEDCWKFPEAVPPLSHFIDLQQISLKQAPPWYPPQGLLHKAAEHRPSSSRWCRSIDIKGTLTEQEPPDISGQGFPGPGKPLAAVDLSLLYFNRNLKPLYWGLAFWDSATARWSRGGMCSFSISPDLGFSLLVWNHYPLKPFTRSALCHTVSQSSDMLVTSLEVRSEFII